MSLQIIAEDVEANSEVSSTEQVSLIPAWRAKPESTSNASVKIAKREKDAFKFPFSATQFKGILPK